MAVPTSRFSKTSQVLTLTFCVPQAHTICALSGAFTRRIVGFSVESANIDDISACRMFKCVSAGQSLPKHTSTDHDPLFRFHRWLANLRVLEIEEISGSITTCIASTGRSMPRRPLNTPAHPHLLLPR